MAKEVLKSERNLSIFVNIIFVLIIVILVWGIMAMGDKQRELTVKLEKKNSQITALVQEKSAWEQGKREMSKAMYDLEDMANRQRRIAGELITKILRDKNAIKVEYNFLRSSNHELVRKLQEVIGAIQGAKKQVVLLSQENEELKKIAKANQDSLKGELQEKDKQIQDLEKKLRRTIIANGVLLSENSKRQITIYELEEQIEWLKEEIKTEITTDTGKIEPIWIIPSLAFIDTKVLGEPVPNVVYFDLNSWKIRDEKQVENLKRITEWMLKLWQPALDKDYQFVIIGFCSFEGGDLYNWGVVGSERALCVEKYLEEALRKQGATEEEINKLLRPVSAGKYHPEYNNPDDNRTVKIYLVKKF